MVNLTFIPARMPRHVRSSNFDLLFNPRVKTNLLDLDFVLPDPLGLHGNIMKSAGGLLTLRGGGGGGSSILRHLEFCYGLDIVTFDYYGLPLRNWAHCMSSSLYCAVSRSSQIHTACGRFPAMDNKNKFHARQFFFYTALNI